MARREAEARREVQVMIMVNTAKSKNGSGNESAAIGPIQADFQPSGIGMHRWASAPIHKSAYIGQFQPILKAGHRHGNRLGIGDSHGLVLP
jgi:hypothetical protein